MSNPKFYAGELDVCTYTMSVAENASFPLSNLHSYVPADLWKSSTTDNNQILTIDLGTALARDNIILDNHNLGTNSSDSVLQYDAADSPAFGSPVTACQLWGGDNSRLKVPFTVQTKRYWRIHFGTGLSTLPQIGNLFIAKELDAGFTYVYPYSAKNEDTASSVRRAVSGIARAARTYGAITKFKLVFDVQDDTFRTAWLWFHQKVIGKTPFYFYDTDDSGWYMFFTDPVEVETYTYGRNRTGELSMETQSVGQNPL